MYDLSELTVYTFHQWLAYIDPSTYDFFKKFGLAVLIGILIGVERERKSDRGDIFAGVRSFTIASVLGMLSAYIAIEQNIFEILYISMLFFIVIATVMIYIKNVVYRHVGITGGLTIFFVFLNGVLVAFDYYLFAIMSAVAITFLLVKKFTLRDFATNLSHDEITNAVQFLILVFILFPIIPDITIMGIINPQYVLSIVVIVSLISFISFMLMKKSGPMRGIPLSGFIGGLVNSEATTGALASLAKKKETLITVSYQGIVLSNATMLIRNLVIAFIVDPSGRFPLLLLPPQLLLAAINTGIVVKEKMLQPRSIETLSIESPFALKPAFKFGFGFTILILMAHYFNIWFGSAGVIALSLGGLVSSAAVTASVGVLSFNGLITPTTAAIVAVIASILSSSNKIFLVRLSGPEELSLKITQSFVVLIGLGIAVIILWLIVILVFG